MNPYRPILALLFAAAVVSCGDQATRDITAPVAGARVKFFNFGINDPSVNFYADGTKVTAISSTSGSESTLGTAYGAAGNGGLYSQVTAGAHTLAGKISAATDNGLSISNLQTTLVDGKSYSYYISGAYDPVAKLADSFIVEDAFTPTIDYTTSYVRFVNAIPNAAPLILYAKNTTTGVEVAVSTAIAYKSAGTFTALPGAVYDLSARYAGATTNAISRLAVGFSAGTVYTIGARGDITITSTTATNRPILDNAINR